MSVEITSVRIDLRRAVVAYRIGPILWGTMMINRAVSSVPGLRPVMAYILNSASPAPTPPSPAPPPPPPPHPQPPPPFYPHPPPPTPHLHTPHQLRRHTPHRSPLLHIPHRSPSLTRSDAALTSSASSSTAASEREREAEVRDLVYAELVHSVPQDFWELQDLRMDHVC